MQFLCLDHKEKPTKVIERTILASGVIYPTYKGPHTRGTIYVMDNSSNSGGGKKRPIGIQKIGLTKNPEERLKQAQSGNSSTYSLSGYNLNPCNFKYKFTFEVTDMKSAESMMFDILRDYKREREIFKDIPENVLNNAINETKLKYGA